MRQTDDQRSQHVSTGAGIAIAGIWLGASALTAILALIAFVWDPKPVSETEMSGGAAWMLLFLIAAPMITAYIATMRVLGRDD